MNAHQTPDARPFIEAIRAAPDDDAPRLVYADWLGEKGDPLGEFITLQCEQARLAGDESEKTRLRKLKARENELFGANEWQWLPTTEGKWEFRRGFAEHLEIHGNFAIKAGMTLFEAAPLLRSMDVGAYGAPEILGVSPILERLEAFKCYGNGARGMALLVGSIALPRLRSLVMTATDMGDAVAAALVARPGLAGVVALDLSAAGLRAPGAVAIGASGMKLRKLDLYDNNLGPDGTIALAKGASLAGLRALELGNNRIGMDGAGALAESPHLRELEALALARGSIRKEGATVIGNAFPHLRSLDLIGNGIGPEGVRGLANGKGLGSLRELSLQQTRTGDEGISHLLASPLAARLTSLNLRSNGITDAGAKEIASATQLSGLRSLNLNNNDLTPAGKKALHESKALAETKVYSAA